MTVTFAYCIGPLDAAIQPPYFFAFIGTFYNATGSRGAATAMTCIITLLTLCSAISNVATASRQMFAFARDKGLPAAGFLSYVRPGWDIPLNSILVSLCITALLSLINLGSTVAFNAIISIGVVSLLSSCKCRFLPSRGLQLPPGPFLNIWQIWSASAASFSSVSATRYCYLDDGALVDSAWPSTCALGRTSLSLMSSLSFRLERL
jgi:amino acid transporter